MKPHVAKVAVVDEKALRPVGADEPVRPTLRSMHSFAVEKRAGIAALMVDVLSWSGRKEEKEGKTTKEKGKSLGLKYGKLFNRCWKVDSLVNRECATG